MRVEGKENDREASFCSQGDANPVVSSADTGTAGGGVDLKGRMMTSWRH